MAKQKYFYKNKKPFLHCVNQQEKDFNYFHSPRYAEIIGKKYGLGGDAVERAFNQYFEAMKYFGLTNLINKDVLRKRIDELEIYYFNGMDDNETEAYTDIINSYIALRKSIKVGDYETLFHEFNHFASMIKFENFGDYNRIDEDMMKFNTIEKEKEKELKYGSGYDIIDVMMGKDFNCGFNEGVTEFLALMQLSYLNKNSSVLGSYYKETSYVHLLYLITGNALFDGYFNGGSFRPLNECFGNQIEISEIAGMISNLSVARKVTDVIDQDYEIQFALMNLLNCKLFGDIIDNIDKFKSFYEIETVITKAYCLYVGGIFFDNTSKSLLNYNREKVFEDLITNYYEIIAGIGEYINDNPDFNKNLKFDFNKQAPTEEDVGNIYALFEMVNDANYAFISYTEKPINIMDYIDDKKINVYNMAKATYLRKQKGIQDVSFMKDRDLYRKVMQKVRKIETSKFYNDQNEFIEADDPSNESDSETFVYAKDGREQ